jgi:hypothetical protein
MLQRGRERARGKGAHLRRELAGRWRAWWWREENGRVGAQESAVGPRALGRRHAEAMAGSGQSIRTAGDADVGGARDTVLTPAPALCGCGCALGMRAC